MVNRTDIPHLRKAGRSLRSTLRAMRLVSQYALQRLRAPRGTTLHLATRWSARLYASLLARNVEVLFATNVEKLLIEGDAISGVRIRNLSGSGISPRAGGSCWRPAASRMIPRSSRTVLSGRCGFGLRRGSRREVATACMSRLPPAPASIRAWRAPLTGCRHRCSGASDGSQGVFPHTVTDRAKPGVIAVNASGKRFVNEALSYHEFVLAMLRDGNDTANRSFYLVCDRHSLDLWAWPYSNPSAINLKRYVKSGELIEAPTHRCARRSYRRRGNGTGGDRQELQHVTHGRGLDPEFGRGNNLSINATSAMPTASPILASRRSSSRRFMRFEFTRPISARRSACKPTATHGCCETMAASSRVLMPAATTWVQS